MLAHVDNQIIALGLVFVVCMLGGLYHIIETNRINRKR